MGLDSRLNGKRLNARMENRIPMGGILFCQLYLSIFFVFGFFPESYGHQVIPTYKLVKAVMGKDKVFFRIFVFSFKS